MGSAEGPELRAIFDMSQPCSTANGGNMIFHFAKHSPTAVHAACLRGIPSVFRFGPGNIGVFARRVNEEIADNERVLVARSIKISNSTGGEGGAQSNLMFAVCAHLEAH